jgi:hypothetical protein
MQNPQKENHQGTKTTKKKGMEKFHAFAQNQVSSCLGG